jgi:hypothetical protein
LDPEWRGNALALALALALDLGEAVDQAVHETVIIKCLVVDSTRMIVHI